MSKPVDVLTEDEVAERAGTTVERVRELTDLGLLEPEEGVFRRRDVLRARVFSELTAMGIEASALAAAQAAGELSFGYLESAGRRHPRSDRTFEQLAADMNITFETFEAIYIAFGLPLPRRDELVRQEDLDGIKSLPVLLGAGVSEGQVLQLARVWGDSARRVAQYESHFTHALLSKSLGDAVKRGHLIMSPVLDPPARDDSVERLAWTRDEVRAFLSVASDDRLGAVWRLVLATGVRRGELLGMQWSDVGVGSVTVARQVLVRPGGGRGRVYVRETTKSRRIRRVRFDEATATALRRWRAAQAEEQLAFGGAWKTDGGLGIEAAWIVTEPDGGVIHPDTLRARWRRLARTAGVREIPLHSARHTYAELALGADVRLDVVSRQLGHASIATTANVYSHDTDEAAYAAARRVGGILGE